MAFPLIPLIGALVPTLVEKVLGSNAAAVTKEVTDAAVEIFGTADKDQIEKAISAQPELAYKLREKLLEIRDREGQRELEAFKASIEDKKSARDLYAKLGGLLVPVISMATTILYFGSYAMILIGAYSLLKDGLPGGVNPEMAIAIAGLVGNISGRMDGKADQVYAFLFGTTVSARQNASSTNDALVSVVKNAKRT